MEVFEIVDCNGYVLERVKAQNERHALCIYLTNHEELYDMMLWQSIDGGMWKLAEYDCEDQFMFAREGKANV